MSYRSLTFFITVLFSLGATAESGVTYTRLIPETVSIPPPAATTSWQVPLIRLIPAASEKALRDALETETQRASGQGLQEAQRLGQKGVLLELRVAKVTIARVTHRTLVGSGVDLVGVGPTPAGVLHTAQLRGRLQAAVPSGMAIDTELSYYLWLEQPKGSESDKFNGSRYEIDQLSRYTQLVMASDASNRALEKATAGAYLQDYGSMLAETARSAKEREAIDELLKSRESAIASLTRIEQELSVRLDQAAKAQRAAATWSTLSTIFSIGASVAMASSTAGTDLRNLDGSVPKTGVELRDSLARLSVERTKQVEVLSDQAKGLKGQMEAINGHILDHGVQRGVSMPGDVSQFLRSPLH